jgi:hypothetical protein
MIGSEPASAFGHREIFGDWRVEKFDEGQPALLGRFARAEFFSCSRCQAPATYPSRWQASPLKRQRRLGVRLEDSRVIAFPRMPRVADLPPGWRSHRRTGLSSGKRPTQATG